MQTLHFMAASAVAVGTMCAAAQSTVYFGKGSIASYPPTYGLVQGADGGWNSQSALIACRTVWADELPPVADGLLERPGRPLDTNNWWTDILASRYSGALWSYPAMLNTSAEGVEVCFPSYWADMGKEVKAKSSLTVGGHRFSADAAIAEDWHDWDVRFRMPDSRGRGTVTVTAAHGMPFTWFEYAGVRPSLKFNARAVDAAAATPIPAGTRPELFGTSAGYVGADFGGDLYGLYFPEGAQWTYNEVEGTVTFADGTEWLAVALLPDRNSLDSYNIYAASIPRSTRVSWSYNADAATVSTLWEVEAENLRSPGTSAPVLQGFLPHVHKHALPGSALSFTDISYLTPRGTMKMATSATGQFAYSYPFAGMLPAYAAPQQGNSDSNGYDPAVMNSLMESYAASGTFGSDTYWGGKGLTQMALNMTFAKQTGNDEAYELSRRRLREALVDWLTYSPGEDGRYLCYFPRWGGILGQNVSYGSDTFNDHHFHFGYFAYAAALLCLEDREFAADYGEVLTLLAKDYANWDREDLRFPFLRTLDPWCGHSWAGGLGDAGNDNGNGQESSSESMQAWGGLYLLGVALGDDDMRDAGIFGWCTEARATREYWFDVDSPRTANDGGREPWPGKVSGGQYDFSLYPYAYNSNTTAKGIGWWTWFGGDPMYMHGIQWMPISPALDYLSWDTDFVAWAYRDLLSGANSTYSHKWFEPTENSADGSRIEPLADNDWGNVTLSYIQRAEPQLAADIFARALAERRHIATAIGTAHITYYTLHHTLTYGAPSTEYTADCPTAAVFDRNGVLTFMAYNPGGSDLNVHFRRGGQTVKTVTAPPGRITAFDDGDPRPSSIALSAEGGTIHPAGEAVTIAARVLDQYGAGMQSDITYAISPATAATLRGNVLTVSPIAADGTRFTLTATAAAATAQLHFTVGQHPVVNEAHIVGLPDDELPVVEVGTELSLSLVWTDQYAVSSSVADAVWTLTAEGGTVEPVYASFTPSQPGVYTIYATGGEPVAEASAQFLVSPPMACISRSATAVSSSEENAGTATANANDGDSATRWGSSHSEDEWIYLDLGRDMFVSRVGVIWEAAYAAEYEVQLAPDGAEMTSHTGNYAGAVRTVQVPAADQWTASATQTVDSYTRAEVATRINATGRYVRMRGVRRATAYGYSLYEMNVYGYDPSAGAEAVLGISLPMPDAITEGESVALRPVIYMRSGATAAAQGMQWSADKPATFSEANFRADGHGMYTVTGRNESGLEASAQIFVYEALHLRSLQPAAAEVEAIEGVPVEVDVTGLSQFGTVIDVSPAVTISPTDAHGAVYDSETATFRADIAGDYILSFRQDDVAADVVVHVRRMADVNLALGKYTWASSVRDRNGAALATDGNTDTRWESEWTENQWIAVDLEADYLIDRIVFVWENASARRYDIEASADGETWHTVHTEPAGKGGTEQITLLAPVQTRYLRMVCHERTMPAYGVSIREWQAYGSPAPSAITAPIDNDAPATYYNLQGIPLPHPAGGLYIAIRNGAATKAYIL